MKKRISALVSDVDGTLVTDDKVLTRRTREAVAQVRAAGIAFSIISSRPPRACACWSSRWTSRRRWPASTAPCWSVAH